MVDKDDEKNITSIHLGSRNGEEKCSSKGSESVPCITPIPPSNNQHSCVSSDISVAANNKTGRFIPWTSSRSLFPAQSCSSAVCLASFTCLSAKESMSSFRLYRLLKISSTRALWSEEPPPRWASSDISGPIDFSGGGVGGTATV